jgi:acetyl-CoA carboxylase biotin carboxyl carrier protein
MRKRKKTDLAATLGSGQVDLQEVERLLEFMALHGLEEFEYACGDLHIRLKKPVAGSARLYAPAAEIVAAEAANPAASRESAAQIARAEELHLIKSPIVGTFYSAPSPGAEPFVQVGGHVEVGQVVCIIEAMKLMNEIESDAAGEVARIYVENGQPVEYGESLFALRPTRMK